MATVFPFSYGHVFLAVVGLSAAFVPANAISAPSNLYDDTRVLLHNPNPGATATECNGALDCEIVKSPNHVLKQGHSREISVHCPRRKPHSWGWDTTQNEPIEAYLVVDTDSELTIGVENVGEGLGSITIFLGCSAQPYRGISGFMQSRVGVPTKVTLPSPNKNGAGR